MMQLLLLGICKIFELTFFIFPIDFFIILIDKLILRIKKSMPFYILSYSAIPTPADWSKFKTTDRTVMKTIIVAPPAVIGLNGAEIVQKKDVFNRPTHKTVYQFNL